MKLKDLVPWRGEEARIPIRRSENPFVSLQREMNELFDDFFSNARSPLALFSENKTSFSPRVNVEETEDQITVTAELPGLEEKDIDLSLTDDAIRLKGTKTQKEERKEGGNYYMESSYGSFERVIPLDVEVDTDKVDASLKNGVLRITLPKVAPTRSETKRISVRTE